MKNEADSEGLRDEVLDAITRWNPETVDDLAQILRKKRRVQFSDEKFASVLIDLRREGKLDLEESDSPFALPGFIPEFRAYGDLLLIVISTLILLLVSLPEEVLLIPVRWIIGIPMVLLFPGYVIQASVFPRTMDLDLWKRFALAVGLSITTTAFYTAILDATPAGITLASVLPLLSFHVLGFSGVGFLRRLGRTRSR